MKSISFEAVNEFSSQSTSDEDGVPSTGVAANGKWLNEWPDFREHSKLHICNELDLTLLHE